MLVYAILSNRFFCLQCPLKECVPGDKMLHILSHFITKTEDELCKIITRYMLSRLDWFESVSCKFLQAENISVEAYIDNLRTPGTPLDLLAIFVLARLYRFHIGFFLNVGMWCTNVHKNMNACKLVLVFEGKTDFHEMYKGGADAYLESLNYYTAKGCMPSHNTEVKAVQEETEDDIVFVSEENTKSAVQVKIEKNIKLEKYLKVSLKRELKLDSMLGFKPKNENTHGKFSAAWKLLAKAKKEVSVKEEHENQRQVISQAIARIVTRSRSQAASCKMIAMDCPVCSTPHRLKRSLLQHIKDDHPGTKFPCKICGKLYDSFNSCYKHERSAHSNKNYLCSVCGHGFDYKSQVEGHMPIHNLAQKVYCKTCDKGFATTSSKKRHSVIHMNLQFPCSNCTKVYNTPEKCQCHFKGTHGTGYQSLCGFYTYNWPGK